MRKHEQGLVRINSLSEDALRGLQKHLDNEGVYERTMVRLGRSGGKNPSVYNTNSLFKLPASTHVRISQLLPEQYDSKAIVRYFIQYPKDRGHLDEQTVWLDSNNPMVIVAWSLNDGNHIMTRSKLDLNSNVRKVARRGVIAHKAGEIHEMVPTGGVEVADLAEAGLLPGNGYSYQSPLVRHEFNAGEGFIMSLSLAHQIAKAGHDQNWFCLGLMPGDIECA